MPLCTSLNIAELNVHSQRRETTAWHSMRTIMEHIASTANTVPLGESHLEDIPAHVKSHTRLALSERRGQSSSAPGGRSSSNGCSPSITTWRRSGGSRVRADNRRQTYRRRHNALNLWTPPDSILGVMSTCNSATLSGRVYLQKDSDIRNITMILGKKL
jgi:hypothetical protein